MRTVKRMMFLAVVSFAAAAIGAEISNGTRPLEYERRTPETVLVISTEETAGDIERKFRYSGADMDKIARIGSEKAYRDGRPRFNLAERPQELASAIRKVSAGEPDERCRKLRLLYHLSCTSEQKGL